MYCNLLIDAICNIVGWPIDLTLNIFESEESAKFLNSQFHYIAFIVIAYKYIEIGELLQ